MRTRTFAVISAAILAGAGVMTSAARASLVGYWSFSETSGSVAHDTSGSGINGALGAGATFDPGTGPGGGGAVLLSSGNGVVSMGNNFVFSGLTPFTVQAWVNIAPGSTQYMLPVGDNFAGSDVGYILELNRPNAGYVGFADAWGSNPVSITPPSATAINDGNWHQIVGVYSATTESLYVDGVFQSSTTRPSISPGADFVVGGIDVGGTDENAFTGEISDVGVWNTALSATDIESNYQAILNQSTPAAIPEPPGLQLAGAALAILVFVRGLRRLH